MAVFIFLYPILSINMIGKFIQNQLIKLATKEINKRYSAYDFSSLETKPKFTKLTKEFNLQSPKNHSFLRDSGPEQKISKFPEKVYRQGEFQQTVLTRWDAPTADVFKKNIFYPPTNPESFPQGMYFDYTKHGINNQYRGTYEEKPGSFVIQKLENPRAKVLTIDQPLAQEEAYGKWGRSGLYTTNAQTLGLKKLMGDEKFYRLMRRPEEDLIQIARRAYPHLDLSAFQKGSNIGGQAGKGGIVGVFAAQKARAAGYDAIRSTRLNEYLAVTDKALLDMSQGTRKLGWLGKIVSGARKMSKAL